jgi:hypothetical protein
LSEEFYIAIIGEIFDGYTELSFRGQPVYLKHVSIRDQRYIHKYYEKYKNLALSKGLETEEDRLAYIIGEEIWTAEDDAQIEMLRFEIEGLEKTISKLPLPSHRQDMRRQIQDLQVKQAEFTLKRRELMGKTAEDYATGRSGDELLRFLLFKDASLRENLFTEKQFGELETWEVAEINKLQSDISKRLEDGLIQKAILRPFFSMYLSLCENARDFYGKPVTELTVHQLRVVLYGRMFFNIFQHTEDIPDEIREDPDKLLLFAEAQRNDKTGKSSSGLRDDADASMVFGATRDDIKSLSGSQGNLRLAEEAEKHGGKLNMEQMMRLAGHDV